MPGLYLAPGEHKQDTESSVRVLFADDVQTLKTIYFNPQATPSPSPSGSTPGASPGMPTTGAPLARIIGAGLIALLAGFGLYVFARRRAGLQP